MKEGLKQNCKDWIVLKGNKQRPNCVCDECNQTYINADQLNEHIKENHFKYTYNCNVGGEGFSQKKYLQSQKEA